MKNTTRMLGLFVFGTMILPILLPSSSQAQVNDSLVYLYWQSGPGDLPGFLDDLNGLGTNRFDATGDNVAEVISVDTNDNGLPITMYVTTLVEDVGLGLKEGDVIYEFNLNEFRQQLLDAGAPEPALRDLRFLRFIPWQDPTREVPVYPLVFGGMDDNGESNIWVCYPALADAANNMVMFSPPNSRFFAFEDFDGDGWPEAIIGDNETKVVKLFSSAFAPGG